MALDEKTKDMIKDIAGPIVTSAASMALVAGLTSLIESLVVTNYTSSDLTGNKEIHPTEDNTSISKVEATAKDTDASLAKDELKVKDGDLSAAKTDANALTTEATAAESGAAAARTKAGAADIETKALKMT